jgi:hypothetical protein
LWWPTDLLLAFIVTRGPYAMGTTTRLHKYYGSTAYMLHSDCIFNFGRGRHTNDALTIAYARRQPLVAPSVTRLCLAQSTNKKYDGASLLVARFDGNLYHDCGVIGHDLDRSDLLQFHPKLSDTIEENEFTLAVSARVMPVTHRPSLARAPIKPD